MRGNNKLKMKNDRLCVTLIIPRYHNMFSSFYTLEIIKEVSEVAIKLGVDLLVSTSWKAQPTSGVLFADIAGNESWIKKARAKKTPYLILNYYAPGSPDNCVGIDNKKAALGVTDYLVRSGHKRIAIITGKLNAQAGSQRLEGFKEALAKAGLGLDKRYIVAGDWSKESGKKAAKKLFSLDKIPSAVFVSGDEMALGALEAAVEAGLKVPQDISLVGFDNIPQAQSSSVPLTTVEQPFAELASLGMKNLIRIIRERPKRPLQVLLESTKLIKRNSVKE
ncbi:MAG: substrate-binding domain-containing protein [Candidatus Omnitrophica bacterium]|nr:substrate-binding domain-containing protein [Candidatus Omnitrophota bacterium]